MTGVRDSGKSPLSTLRVPSQRVFCLVAKREVVATGNHLGQLTCPACGEHVQPVVQQQRDAA